MTLKAYLQKLLSQNELKAAVALAYSVLKDEEEWQELVTQFSARRNEYARELQADTTDPDDLRRLRNNILGDFMRFVSELPEEISFEGPDEAGAEKPQGILEAYFKWHVFLGILLFKGGVLLFLSYIANTGGIPPQEFGMLRGLMLPVFAASFVLMIKHLLEENKRPGKPDPEGPRISRITQWVVYMSLIFYAIAILSALRTYATETRDFATLQSWFTGTEAVLGGVVGYIVSMLFKGNND